MLLPGLYSFSPHVIIIIIIIIDPSFTLSCKIYESGRKSVSLSISIIISVFVDLYLKYLHLYHPLWVVDYSFHLWVEGKGHKESQLC